MTEMTYKQNQDLAKSIILLHHHHYRSQDFIYEVSQSFRFTFDCLSVGSGKTQQTLVPLPYARITHYHCFYIPSSSHIKGKANKVWILLERLSDLTSQTVTKDFQGTWVFCPRHCWVCSRAQNPSSLIPRNCHMNGWIQGTPVFIKEGEHLSEFYLGFSFKIQVKCK